MPHHPLLEAIDFQAEGHPVQFLGVRSFLRDARKIFTTDEMTGFLNYVSANPACGDVVPGTSGLRKIRWGANGQGKRGGARVIYYFRDLNMPLLLLAVYPKSHVVQLSKKKMTQIEKQVEFLIGELTTQCEEDARVSGRRA